MSISSEITRINGNIADAYDAVSGKGGTLPAAQNSANLPAAIASITPAKPEQAKTLTLGASAPSTVTPDSGKVLSSVPVVLDTSVIKAENIAKDVTMLGVTGTHEGGGGGLTDLAGTSWDLSTITEEKFTDFMGDEGTSYYNMMFGQNNFTFDIEGEQYSAYYIIFEGNYRLTLKCEFDVVWRYGEWSMSGMPVSDIKIRNIPSSPLSKCKIWIAFFENCCTRIA